MTQSCPDNATLRALHPGPLRAEQALGQDGNVIGRDARHADILLHGPSVSRRHCWLGRDGDGHWLLRDLKSRNGVYVNGIRVGDLHRLHNGDVIGLGNSRVPDFEFLAGPNPGARRVMLTGSGPWLIGRKLDLAICLAADPMVSKRHARILALPGGLVIEDLGSRNGTWVDGRRVRRTRLADLTPICIGSSEMRLDLADSSRPALSLQSTQRAIGLRAEAVAPNSVDESLGFTIQTGRLQFLNLADSARRQRLLECIAGLHQLCAGSLHFDETELDDNLTRRTDRIGLVSHNEPLPGQQRVADYLGDQASLALAGDLGSAHRRALVNTTLEALEMGAVASKRLAQLSPLERQLCLIAAQLLTRPGLLLIDNPAAGLNAEAARELIERLRGLIDSSLTVLIAGPEKPVGLDGDEIVTVTTSTGPSVQTTTQPTALASRQPTWAASATLWRRHLADMRERRPLFLVEALLLPAVLVPLLWRILPAASGGFSVLVAITASIALSSAFLATGQSSVIPGLARRHRLLADMLLALFATGLLLALAQILIATAIVSFSPGMSTTPLAVTLMGMLSIAPGAVALGMLCGVIGGVGRIAAMILVVAAVSAQVGLAVLVDASAEPGFLLARLADLSLIHWGTALLDRLHDGNSPAVIQALAFLLAQTLLLLALTRGLMRRQAYTLVVLST
jgi:pSer/pThr/pTyr-binding forkhead associated (FHA) protein/energy-coupling factor transporter ATP-binding protein EcfA2